MASFQHCEFLLGVASLEQLPQSDLPEVAFAGRSNVGKSSLINALTGRKALARTSVTPGRTQQLNYFTIDNQLLLVDMPGYGYAKASKKDIKSWNRLVRGYLRGRSGLRRVYVLLDARRGGLMEADREIMELLDASAVSYQLVLTKTDKLKPAELEEVRAALMEAMKSHPACHPDIIATSAHGNEGIDTLREAIVS